MEISSQFLLLVPIVVGLVQAIKATGFLPSQFAALVSVVIGVLAVGLLSAFTGPNLIEGIFVGLSAAGLYSGTRATLNI
jgi:hypothetical protein